MIFDWLSPTYPTIALSWTPINRLYYANNFSLFKEGPVLKKPKKLPQIKNKINFFNALYFIIPKGRQLRDSWRIDLSIKYSWLVLNCIYLAGFNLQYLEVSSKPWKSRKDTQSFGSGRDMALSRSLQAIPFPCPGRAGHQPELTSPPPPGETAPCQASCPPAPGLDPSSNLGTSIVAKLDGFTNHL